MTARRPTTVARTLDIPSLDGLRALSIVVVFVADAGLEGVLPGGLGVTIFFFLSGYLITTLLRVEYDRFGRVSFRDFYTRRVFRILPPFYVVLIGATALAALHGVSGQIGGLPFVGQALFASNYLEIARPEYGPAGTGVFWSLAVEEHFYLLFPALYLFLRRRYEPRRQASVLAVVCAVVLLWRCVLVLGLHVSEFRTFYATDTRLDAILWGCILAIAANPMLDRRSEQWGRRQRLAFAASIALLLGSLLVRNPQFRETLRYTVQSLALIPIFFLAISHPQRWPFRLLQNYWVRWLGVLSYSVYLVHHVLLFSLHQHTTWNSPVIGVVAFVASVALAYGMHRAIELPAGAMRRRVLARVATEANRRQSTDRSTAMATR